MFGVDTQDRQGGKGSLKRTKMENEYAKFGLPDDPANQPILLSRLPPCSTAGSSAICGGCCQPPCWSWSCPAAAAGGSSGGSSALKSSEPYQMALERVRTNRDVIELLGEPVEEAGWMPTGNFSYHTNNGVASGRASFNFSVSGPKGTAHVHAEAICRNGKWSFRVLRVTPASGGRTISLPTDEKPAKAEEEDGADWN